MSEIPQKRFYKIGEVCQYTDTQPYVVRFWESEFPQLKPEEGGGGNSTYSRADIDLILRIKQLLYDEEYTLDGARRRLAEEGKRKGKGKGKAAKPKRGEKPASRQSAGSTKQARSKAAEPSMPPEAAVVPEAGARPRTEVRAPQTPLEFDTVARERYEDAVEEVAHLRHVSREAETKARKAITKLEQLQQVADEYRRRCEKVAVELEKLLERLD